MKLTEAKKSELTARVIKAEDAVKTARTDKSRREAQSELSAAKYARSRAMGWI